MNYYCSAVDTGLFVYVQGEIKICCSGTDILGNIQEQPIQQMFSGQKFIEIRDTLRDNKPHSYCQGCYDIEKTAPGSSQMSAFNDQYPKSDKRNLKLIDIRWSNVCNLSCRYCNTQDSSEWRRISGMPIETVNKGYIESLFEEIEQNKDTIDSVYLLGGEPLMQKYNERLLSIVNPNVKIDLLTNGSVRLDNNKVYQALKRFPNVYWNLSFDNVGDRFEYVRQGGDWQLFKSNVQTLLNDFGKNHVTFHPVYHVWNALNLKEFYDFADEMGGLRVNWQVGLPKVDPMFPTDSFLTFGHNKKIIERAIEEIDSLTVNDSALNGIKESLITDQEDTTKGPRFLKWVEEMEHFMPPKKTFEELWSELNILLRN